MNKWKTVHTAKWNEVTGRAILLYQYPCPTPITGSTMVTIPIGDITTRRRWREHPWFKVSCVWKRKLETERERCVDKEIGVAKYKRVTPVRSPQPLLCSSSVHKGGWVAIYAVSHSSWSSYLPNLHQDMRTTKKVNQAIYISLLRDIHFWLFFVICTWELRQFGWLLLGDDYSSISLWHGVLIYLWVSKQIKGRVMWTRRMVTTNSASPLP